MAVAGDLITTGRFGRASTWRLDPSLDPTGQALHYLQHRAASEMWKWLDERGIHTKDLARQLGVNEGRLRAKLNGTEPCTLSDLVAWSISTDNSVFPSLLGDGVKQSGLFPLEAAGQILVTVEHGFRAVEIVPDGLVAMEDIGWASIAKKLVEAAVESQANGTQHLQGPGELRAAIVAALTTQGVRASRLRQRGATGLTMDNPPSAELEVFGPPVSLASVIERSSGEGMRVSVILLDSHSRASFEMTSGAALPWNEPIQVGDLTVVTLGWSHGGMHDALILQEEAK